MKLITRIPTHLNDGSPVSAESMQTIWMMIAERFGGVSVDPPGSGAWLDEQGKVYDEPSYLVTFATANRSDYVDARQLVIEIGKLLGQKAMYFEVQYFDGVEIIDTT
ncbi:MAG: hypothetical protein WD049_06560 [Candidatus Paceibacterota bacterium]